jgi:hypothetical protein
MSSHTGRQANAKIEGQIKKEFDMTPITDASNQTGASEPPIPTIEEIVEMAIAGTFSPAMSVFWLQEHVRRSIPVVPAVLSDERITDAEMFEWWFSDAPKPPQFINAYLDGVRAGWCLDQWRNAIRLAMLSAVPVEPKP